MYVSYVCNTLVQLEVGAGSTGSPAGLTRRSGRLSGPQANAWGRLELAARRRRGGVGPMSYWTYYSIRSKPYHPLANTYLAYA